MTTAPRAALGSHLPVAGGLACALDTADRIGAESVQVFVSNPRGWATPDPDPVADRAFAARAADEGRRVLVHAPYLVNLGSPSPTTCERSLHSVAHALGRAARIGATGVVVHTGSRVTEGFRDQALKQVRERLLPLLDALPDDGPDVLLEPTAGQGRSLCATVEDLETDLDALDHHPRARVCLDTCHAFAAGHDLARPGGTTALLDRLVQVLGPGRLAAVHANDSLDACGSLRDRHARIGRGRIGRGRIGTEAFRELLARPAVAGLPVLLETPGGMDAYAEDLALLEGLRP